MSSLSYARRKTEELGLKNIEYMQADILDLGMLDQQFDIIESAGVLHHMADPVAGWKVLVDCLKPGGLMKIGLYSELARQDIVRARSMINERNISSEKQEMLSFREQLFNIDIEITESIKSSNNFFSTSELRDLLFHTQEHRFTLPQIDKVINVQSRAQFLTAELKSKEDLRNGLLSKIDSLVVGNKSSREFSVAMEAILPGAPVGPSFIKTFGVFFVGHWSLGLAWPS